MAGRDYFSRKWLYGVLALLLVLNGLWMFRMSGELTPAVAGNPAPDFTLSGLPREGHTRRDVALGELQGQVVVLDFWATWCGPCLEAMPELSIVHRRLHHRGLTVVGVLTADADLDTAARVAERKGVEYPLVVDADGRVADRYGAHDLPTVVVVDRRGVIRSVQVGLRPPGTLARTVEPLLSP